MVRAEESSIKQKVKRLQSQSRRAARREQDPFTRYQKEVAITLYLLNGWEASAAVAHLEGLYPGRPGLDALVEAWVLSEPLESITLMDEKDTAPRSNVFDAASAFFVKWKLARWVEDQNSRCGLAPPTASRASSSPSSEAEVNSISTSFRFLPRERSGTRF